MVVDDPLFQMVDEELSRFQQLLARYEGRGTGRAGGLGKHGARGAGGAHGHRAGNPVPMPGMGGRGGPPRPPSPGAPPGGPGAGPSMEEAERIALEVMLDEQDNFIGNIFGKGAKLGWKGKRNPLREGAEEARKASEEFRNATKTADDDRQAGRSLAPSSEPAKELSSSELQEITRKNGKDLGKSVFRMLGNLDERELKVLVPMVEEMSTEILADLGSSLVPLVGTGKAGVRMVGKWVSTARKQMDVLDAHQAREKVVPGDPEAAVAAVERLLKRERTHLAEEAGIATAKFAFDAAEFAVDFGVVGNAVSSVAEAMAKLALKVHELIRDCRELGRGREILRAKRLGAEMFNTCPILGAYAVTSANTSALVGFLGGSHHLGAMDKDRLERVINKYEKPLQENATKLIAASRMEVTGLPTNLAKARMAHYQKKQKTVANRLRELAGQGGKLASKMKGLSPKNPFG